MPSTRRTFLQSATATAAAAATLCATGITRGVTLLQSTPAQPAGDLPLQTPESTREGDMLYRTLGRTGQKVSLVGLGGFHIGMQKTDDESIALIRRAIDSGITFMDNSWDYNEGRSEERMGKALRDGYRAKVFLMTKIDGRTKAEAAKQIDQSLQRLQTDHVDLLQHHEILRMED